MKHFIIWSTVILTGTWLLMTCAPPRSQRTPPVTNCSVIQLETGAQVECPDGSKAFVPNGSVGPQGLQPSPIPGEPGKQCTVEQLENGARIICADSEAIVMNGANGIDAVLEVIDPCGNDPEHFDEVLLRLASGELVAYFEDGGKRFLAILSPNTYQTTDKQRCLFTVSEDLQVTW